MHADCIITWYSMNCPACKAVNFVCDGDTSDDTRASAEAVECHKCSAKFWLNEFDMQNYNHFLEEQEYEDGSTEPARTPEQILEEFAYCEKGKDLKPVHVA